MFWRCLNTPVPFLALLSCRKVWALRPAHGHTVPSTQKNEKALLGRHPSGAWPLKKDRPSPIFLRRELSGGRVRFLNARHH